MGVQIIENWTDVEGDVLTVEPESGVPRFGLVTIRVARAQSVEGFANLLGAVGGGIVRVHVPAELLTRTGVGTGSRVICRVRRAGVHDIFSHPQRFGLVPSR